MMEPRALHARCDTCPLYCEPRRKRDPQVNGSGPDLADVVVVGMAPGDTEVTLKKVFVGPSGRLLDALLTKAGLSRNNVYVTNTILCTTHDGKTNLPVPAAATKACQARLFEEIRLRQPKVVVAMGNDVLRAFGVDDKVSDCRGRERWLSVEHLRAAMNKGRRKRDLDGFHFDEAWTRGGFYLLPTYHPAYCLRSPDRAPDLAKDIERIPAIVAMTPDVQRTFPTVDYRVADTSQEVVGMLNSMKGTVACDIEATGLDPITGRLLTLAYAWREDDKVRALVLPAVLVADRAVRDGLARLHARTDVRQVWWNGKFDRKWYKHHLGITPRIDGDGMLAHYALDARKGVHGLKERSSDDLGADDYEHELKGWIKKNGWEGLDTIEDAPLDQLYQYTALDVGMTLQLTELYESEHDERTAWVYRSILLPSAAVLSDVELTGVAVDVDALGRLDAHFVDLLAGYQRRLWDAAGVEFNVASQPQVATILYGHAVREAFPSINKRSAADLPTFSLPLVVNAQNTPATGADACDKILNRGGLDRRAQEFVSTLRNYRLDAQLYRTYVKKLPLVVHADGRVRANFNLHVTTTGRLSSSEPINLQNIPTRREEGGKIKDAFVAAPGHLLVEVDLSQAELRTAAFLSGDPLLTAIYTDGRDFHHEVAVRILGSEQLAKELRPFIKTFNFALMYGAEVPMLVSLLNDTAIEIEQRTNQPQKRWEDEEVQALYDGFWDTFPDLRTWLWEVRAQARETGEVASHFGRIRRWYVPTREMEKEAGNHPIQSTAADCLNLSMIEIHDWLNRTGYGRVVLTVHDSLLIEAHEAAAVEVAHMAVRIMKETPLKHGITVPFEADAKIGERWASLTPLDKVLEGVPV